MDGPFGTSSTVRTFLFAILLTGSHTFIVMLVVRTGHLSEQHHMIIFIVIINKNAVIFVWQINDDDNNDDDDNDDDDDVDDDDNAHEINSGLMCNMRTPEKHQSYKGGHLDCQ